MVGAVGSSLVASVRPAFPLGKEYRMTEGRSFGEAEIEARAAERLARGVTPSSRALDATRGA